MSNGAPKEILYQNKPHIGTDNLINIVSNIRKYIIEQGGEFLFENKVVDFNIENNQKIMYNIKVEFELFYGGK